MCKITEMFTEAINKIVQLFYILTAKHDTVHLTASPNKCSLAYINTIYMYYVCRMMFHFYRFVDLVHCERHPDPHHCLYIVILLYACCYSYPSMPVVFFTT